ncbi:MAG TPA: secretin N-terminal domain-containing protein [Acidobacteriota bacterium]|nr:secretin N-terminal domain-containing protein [Acidobacteriota bacterium]
MVTHIRKSKGIIVIILSAFILFGVYSAASAFQAQNKPAAAPIPAAVRGDSQKVTLNFENLDLYAFVNQVSIILGLTPIVIDPDVRGSVTLLMTSPVSKEDVFPLFNLVLKSKNTALVKQRGIYQIVPISSALRSGLEIIEHLPETAGKDEADLSPEAQREALKASAEDRTRARAFEDPRAPRLASHVIRVEFVPVKDLIEPIKLFMTEGGVIMPYERLNMLIVTDYTDSMDKILQIIRMLDSSYLDPDLVELVEIRNNKSADVVEDLQKIFATGKDAATGVSFVALDRLNAIFVMAGSRRGLSEVKRWIEVLDTSSSKKYQTFIYVVQNATASNIALMISALFGEDGAVAGQTGATAAGAGGAAAGAPATQRQQMDSTFNQGFWDGGTLGSGQRLGPQLNISRGVTSQVLRGQTFSGLKDVVRMVVDEINNSLIIQATPVDYAFILDTIKQMDVLPRQAIIDSRIFEVDLTDSLQFGVNAILQPRANGERQTTAGMSATGTLSANTFAFIGNTREILMALETLRAKTSVRILEAPSVLALDGTPARIHVGSEIPYPAGSFTGTAGSTTSVSYRPTGISLLVVPRISASGSVTLDITKEVSSVGPSLTIGLDEKAPTFSKTEVMTTLSVRDGETVAIAGLIRDSNNVSRAGIPFLSDIPVLGHLFGGTSRDTRRTELIILITPHVIRTVEGFQQMTQELRDSLRNVRRLADEKDREHMRDMEDARREREERETRK